jgi:hypothetical protein
MLEQINAAIVSMAYLLQLITKFSQYFLFPPTCFHVMGIGNSGLTFNRKGEKKCYGNSESLY